jgi:methylenetetrahydrofolate reductase (NADH)
MDAAAQVDLRRVRRDRGLVMDNRLRDALATRRFAVVVEVVAPSRDRELAAALAPALDLARAVAGDPRVAALSVTDRVRSDDDHDPVQVAALLAAASGATPIVHLSGKDRAPEQLARALGGLAAIGIDNVLCVTGDRLKAMPADRRVRFLDSVEAVAITRRLWPAALVAAGVSPFKYTEEETHNQYLKMARKQAAGADYLITQVGWDMCKLDELARYRRARGFRQPVIAEFMVLPPGVARHIHKGAVPGVVITDDLLAVVEHEAKAADKGRAARLTRLALQVVGAEHLGYAGVQLSGLGTHADVSHVLELAAQWRARSTTLDAWWRAWEDSLRLPDGMPARLHREPGYFFFDRVAPHPAARTLRPAERRRYTLLHAVHEVFFNDRSPVSRLLRPLARRVPTGSRLADGLAALERRMKAPLVGCELCGYCRLPDTFYVCPETCPKGLANGPCGGSMDNTCEAGDRECIHSLKYRLAKAAGRLDDLERGVIPGVPEPRGGSSWLRHFSEEGR